MSDFNFVVNGTWGEYLLIDSNRLDETIKYIRENKIKNVELNFYHGYGLKDIAFLTQVKDVIEGLNVIQGDISLKGIEQLKNLQRLNISDESNCSIDFSEFNNLERCSILWNENLKNLSSCAKLKELLIKKVSNEELEEICKGLSGVELMTLIQSRLIDLNFLKSFPVLKVLEIYYSPSLEDIQGLLYVQATISKLLLDHCKKVKDYNVISSLGKLEYLGINDAGKISTLSFTQGLKNLTHLSFVGTNVLDGDMSYCVGIDYVGRDNKKHYSTI